MLPSQSCWNFVFALSFIRNALSFPIQHTVLEMPSSRSEIVQHTSPLLLLDSSSSSSSSSADDCCSTAMVILNAPIAQPPSPLFERLWQSSSFCVCADGGANRLRHATPTGDNQKYVPNVITGDLDSLSKETRAYYEEKGVEIVEVIDQDRNDLDKALSAVLDHYKQASSSSCFTNIRCVVYGAFGGRFDQEMASFQALYKWQGKLQLWLYDDSTMALLLNEGSCENHIQLALPSRATPTCSKDTTAENDHIAVGEGPVCGLIPLGCAVDSVTTTGLQWNLNDQPTRFGDLVSTSNRIVVPEQPATTLPVVIVKCSQPLVFTAEVHSRIAGAWSK